jgi:hypothetical protein
LHTHNTSWLFLLFDVNKPTINFYHEKDQKSKEIIELWVGQGENGLQLNAQ